jgi:hypothetical protein
MCLVDRSSSLLTRFSGIVAMSVDVVYFELFFF